MAKITEIKDSTNAQNSLRNRTTPVRQSVANDTPTTEIQEEHPHFIQSVFMSVGFIFLFAFFQFTVHLQFRKSLEISLDNPNFIEISQRIITSFPALLAFIYYTHKYSESNWMQYLFLVFSIGVGYYNTNLILSRSSFNEMSMTPGLGTLWAYCLVQMSLTNDLLSLLVSFGCVFIHKFLISYFWSFFNLQKQAA